ncbi:MAG: tetratricopeptide repeat protein [Alphaproteobacteria bacterium]
MSGDPSYHNNYGNVLLQMKRWDKAATAFGKSLEIAPLPILIRRQQISAGMYLPSPPRPSHNTRPVTTLQPHLCYTWMV